MSKSIEMRGKTTVYHNLQQARAAALEASKGKNYVTLFNCFGLELTVSKRLPQQAAGDSFTKTYWYNGKEVSFTNAQKVANDRAGQR